jgi:glutamate 5-kinase
MPRVIVVKLGTSLVTGSGLGADAHVLASIARQVVGLLDEGRHVAVVSSGAVGLGMSALGWTRRPRELPGLQAAAAVGQPLLMDAWRAAFAPFGRGVGQVLMTREDADDRGRFLNVRDTVDALWSANAVPIVNENDATSTAELGGRRLAGAASFGDNDLLAASLSAALSARLLVLLSTVPGLLDDRQQVVPAVRDVAQARRLVRRETSAGGLGGMASKLAAASLVTGAGEAMVLADGRADDALLRAVRGEAVGTRFEPTQSDRLTGRLRWIAQTTPAGRLTLDAGAVRAVRDRDASLLPAGVTGVEGRFSRGDVVALIDPAGHVFAKGLANHDAAIAARLIGRRSTDLDQPLQAELVHRDYLVPTNTR